jgi:ketosteroid isomerase-like protein
VTSRVESLLPIFEPLLEEGAHAKDAPQVMGHARAALAAIAAPDLEVAMIAPDAAFRQEFVGVDGFVEGWTDWLTPFESFRLQVDDLIESGDNLVTLVRQFGTPVGSTVEIESIGAAVWTFSGDRLVRVEFHLDRAQGLRAAGIEPTAQLIGRNSQSCQE